MGKTLSSSTGVWARSLVQELGSHMPCGKKTQNPKQKQYGSKLKKDLKKKKNKSQLSSQEDCYYVMSVLQSEPCGIY